MTTHVFIVDDNTFKYHLEYMFAGTGAKNNKIDFNNSKKTKLHYATESNLVAMMADGCRIRKNDLIIFYVRATAWREGMFYGIFQAVDDGIFLDKHSKQFLGKELKKTLTFRLQIKPYEVYAKGVTEWTALDEIKKICSPYQMHGSLIYRKLKGNRGNTMITIYEAERLINLIRNENDNKGFDCSNCGFTYNADTNLIEKITQNKRYSGKMEAINILPRLIEKFNCIKAHESHLQMYITQNIGRGVNKSLDTSLGIENKKIEWLGNEVACGVGMQRIDILFSVEESSTKRVLFPIELKAVFASSDNTYQLTRYIDWIRQYYIPNRISTIQPILICKKKGMLSDELKESFYKFNERKEILPLKYIEYEIKNKDIVFENVDYSK